MYASRRTDAPIQSQELSKARESLVGAETSKKHLEERVDDLSRQLQGQHEKLAVYERRPGVTGATQPTNVDMNHEQQLEAEVAELRLVTRLVVIPLHLDSHIIPCRSALKVAQMHLATARSHVQQFQDISQANETALASLNNTYDEYKSSTEAQMARHEVCCILCDSVEHCVHHISPVGLQGSRRTTAGYSSRTLFSQNPAQRGPTER